VEFVTELGSTLRRFLPALVVIAGTVLALGALNWFLLRRREDLSTNSRFHRQIAMLLLSGVAIVVVLLALPVSDTTRGQLLSLLGLLLTAVIALSSTTFVANAMAGLMLRIVRNFRPGDFIRVGEHFGRMTERGLFHTEIQTEDRDLMTIPNLYLVTNPVTVVHSSGTIVSVSLSLGYDVHHAEVERLLLEAARDAGLEDPFTQIQELGNFAVSYRIAGFLREVKQMLTSRSRLRASILTALHGAGIEIVSPTFMNQRALDPTRPVRPREPEPAAERPPLAQEKPPEELIFDKADRAQAIAGLRLEREKVVAEIVQLEADKREAAEADLARLEREISDRERRRDAIEAQLQATEQAEESTEP
jgi:small-conductance mechanosensitive channel